MESHQTAPGPGWTLGDDGHWQPPPFHLEGPVASGPTGPDEDAPRRRRSGRGRAAAGRLGRGAAAGVFGTVCLIGAIAAGSSVYHGVQADQDEASPLDDHSEARQRYQGQNADQAASVWGPVGNPDTICPTAAEVAAATGDEPAAATYAYDETTRVNGIPLFGPRCNYGEHVHVGAAAAPGDLVTWLRDSEGDYEITAGSLDVPSVVVTEAPDPGVEGRGAGSVRVVFQLGVRTFWVMVDTTLADRAEDLAALVRARNA